MSRFFRTAASFAAPFNPFDTSWKRDLNAIYNPPRAVSARQVETLRQALESRSARETPREFLVRTERQLADVAPGTLLRSGRHFYRLSARELESNKSLVVESLDVSDMAERDISDLSSMVIDLSHASLRLCARTLNLV